MSSIGENEDNTTERELDVGMDLLHGFDNENMIEEVSIVSTERKITLTNIETTAYETNFVNSFID